MSCLPALVALGLAGLALAASPPPEPPAAEEDAETVFVPPERLHALAPFFHGTASERAWRAVYPGMRIGRPPVDEPAPRIQAVQGLGGRFIGLDQSGDQAVRDLDPMVALLVTRVIEDGGAVEWEPELVVLRERPGGIEVICREEICEMQRSYPAGQAGSPQVELHALHLRDEADGLAVLLRSRASPEEGGGLYESLHVFAIQLERDPQGGHSGSLHGLGEIELRSAERRAELGLSNHRSSGLRDLIVNAELHEQGSVSKTRERLCFDNDSYQECGLRNLSGPDVETDSVPVGPTCHPPGLRVLGWLDLPGPDSGVEYQRLDVERGKAWLCASDGMLVLDVADPRRMRIAGHAEQSETDAGVYAGSSVVLLRGEDEEHTRLACFGPRQRMKDAITIEGAVSGADASGRSLWLSGGAIRILDVGPGCRLGRPRGVPGEGSGIATRRVRAYGHLAYYLADLEEQELLVVEQTQGGPRIVGRVQSDGSHEWQDIEIVGSKLVVKTDGGLVLYDLSQPRAPRRVAEFEIAFEPDGLAGAGQMLFVWGGGDFQIVDLGYGQPRSRWPEDEEGGLANEDESLMDVLMSLDVVMADVDAGRIYLVLEQYGLVVLEPCRR
ncbi:MAG: hypothetical protein JXR96_13580 [Deltaproteobacteria bacterium]|nr:hypothetical protein [Deltaproteobacteria bacterium]